MRHCFICGSNEKEFFYDSSVLVPAPYPLSGEQSIVQCSTCGFIYGDSSNTLSHVENYYTTLNKHQRRAVDAAELDHAYFVEITKYLDDLCRDSRVLDFGSGDLLMKETLINMGFSNIQTYDIGRDEPTDKFDFIISTHTFEHILNANEVISKLNSMLADEGQLLIAVPDVNGYEATYCGPYNYFDLEHINHFSLASLTNLFLTNNFSVKSSSEGSREVRPGLFYPEIIVIGTKTPIHNEIKLINDIVKSKAAIMSYIELSEQNFSKGLDLLNTFRHKKCLMWGIGIWMMRIAYHAKLNNVSFIDSDPRLRGREIYDNAIIGPDELTELDPEHCVFFVAAVNSSDIVKSIRQKFGQDIDVIVL